jgi:hypothetical protein
LNSWWGFAPQPLDGLVVEPGHHHPGVVLAGLDDVVAGGSGAAGAAARWLPVRASMDTPSPGSRPSTVVVR